MDILQIPSHEETVAICQRNGLHSNGVSYGDNIWIKYGSGVTQAEAEMQRFIHQRADHDLVRVPNVYDSFTKIGPGGFATTYIVMEKVHGETFAEYKENQPERAEAKLKSIADAIRHIWSIPVPDDSSPGPLEGTIPEDRFFSSDGRGKDFKDLIQLEDWINGKLAFRNKPERANFRSEKLQVCHCDLSQWNIMVDDFDKPPFIIDWGLSGMCPRVFEEYAIVQQFHRHGSKFAKDLHRDLFGPKLSSNMRPFSWVAAWNAFGLHCI